MSVELDEVYGFLAQHEPFSTLPEDTLCALPAQMGITYVRRGQAVVEVGQPNDTLFVIRSGAVDIVSADNLLLDRREAFLELLEQFPDMGRFFQTASRRVRAAAEEVRDGGATEVLRTPLRRIFAGREPVTRDKHVSIAEAARTMGDEGISSLIITDGQEVAGIIADADMRSRVVAAGVDTSRPVADVMTSPVRTITPNALVFEAMLTMSELGIHHLPVASDTQVVGVVTAADIMHQLQADPIYLAADVAQASQQELEGAYRDAARVAVRLFERGASAAETQRLLTSIADAVAKRLGTLAVEKLGPAGVRGVGAGQRPGDRPRRRRILCSARGGRGESATLHGVTDDEVTSLGREPAEVLEAFLAALDGRKLLAHFAQMETGFLGKLPRMCAGPSGGCTTVRWLTPSPWSGATWNAWAPTLAAKTCVCPGCGSVITCRCTRTTTR